MLCPELKRTQSIKLNCMVECAKVSQIRRETLKIAPDLHCLEPRSPMDTILFHFHQEFKVLLFPAHFTV